MKKKIQEHIYNTFSNANMVCLIISIVSLILMLLFAGNRSLWSDDMYTIYTAEKGIPFSENLARIFNDAHSSPPLFYLFSYLWMRIAPYGTLFLKLPSILFVTLGIFFCGLCAKSLKGDRAGIWASLFAGTSTFLIINGAYVFRVYGLLFFLVTSLTLIYIKRMKEANNERASIITLYGIAMAVLLYTFYFGVIIIGLIALVDLAFIIRRIVSKRILVSYLIAGILFFPFFIYAVRLFFISTEVISYFEQAPSIKIALHSLYAFFSGSIFVMLCFFVAVIMLLSRNFISLIDELISKQNRLAFQLIAFIPVLTIIIVFIYSRYINPSGSIFTNRYFISILPFLLVGSAIGFDILFDIIFTSFSNSVKEKFFIFILVIFSIFLGDKAFFEVYRNPGTSSAPFEQAIEYIYKQSDAHLADSVLITNSESTNIAVQYYITHDGKRLPFNSVSFGAFIEESNLYNRVYFFDERKKGLSDMIIKYLEEDYELAYEKEDVRVSVYLRK